MSHEKLVDQIIDFVGEYGKLDFENEAEVNLFAEALAGEILQNEPVGQYHVSGVDDDLSDEFGDDECFITPDEDEDCDEDDD